MNNKLKQSIEFLVTTVLAPRNMSGELEIADISWPLPPNGDTIVKNDGDTKQTIC
jgi:hypothetical protein